MTATITNTVTDPLKEDIKTTEISNLTKAGEDSIDTGTNDTDSLEALFQDRDTLPLPKAAQTPKEVPTQKADESKTPDDKKDHNKREAVSSELQTLKEELEKTHKRLAENQHYGRQNAQRLKNALKLTKAFVEEGSLSEEEAIKLMGSLEHDDEADAYSHQTHPFGKVLATANKELDNIRKYTDDDHLDDKVAAFDYFLMVSSPEEREQALEDLTDLMDNPLTLAKKMLAIGQDHAHHYRDMKEAGSLHGLITKKDQDILNLRKNLDKLTKKLAHFEDYDKPRYRLDDHVGEMSGLEEDALPKDTISSLFHHRDAIRTAPGR